MADPRPGTERQYRIDDEWSRNVFARRTGEAARFFLPYLQAGMRLIDCGCGPGSITDRREALQVRMQGIGERVPAVAAFAEKRSGHTLDEIACNDKVLRGIRLERLSCPHPCRARATVASWRPAGAGLARGRAGS